LLLNAERLALAISRFVSRNRILREATLNPVPVILFDERVRYVKNVKNHWLRQ